MKAISSSKHLYFINVKPIQNQFKTYCSDSEIYSRNVFLHIKFNTFLYKKIENILIFVSLNYIIFNIIFLKKHDMQENLS